MENKDCKHQNTRKLFYQGESTWKKTNYSICLDCGKALELKEVKKE